MMNIKRFLIILNVCLASLITFQLLDKAAQPKQDISAESVGDITVVTVPKGGGSVKSKQLKIKEEKRRRKERLSARFFLPIPGERNSLSDLIDGMVIEKINKNVPATASFKKLLKEENSEIDKEELQEKVNVFKELVSFYLKDLYKSQRGLEERDSAQDLADLKLNLNNRLALDARRFERLIEIEKGSKTDRQLKVFEKLLVKDRDKLSEEQRTELTGALLSRQVTIFEEVKSIDEHFTNSDELLQTAQQILKPDQAEHFKYFQEYHWHSNNLPEVNDLPRLF